MTVLTRLLVAVLASVQIEPELHCQSRVSLVQERAQGSRGFLAKKRVEAQDRLFARQFDSDIELKPTFGTVIGDNRGDARLDDYSLRGATLRNHKDWQFLRQIRAISTEGFSEQDRISHDLLVRILEDRVVDYSLKTFEMPISQLDGIHLSLADLPNAMPFETSVQYGNYVARLKAIPRAMAETMTVLEQGERDGLMPPRLIIGEVLEECSRILQENPFLTPTAHFPKAFSEDTRRRFRREIAEAVGEDVLPAYQRFSTFLATRYEPNARESIGLSDLPDGLRRYQQDIREQTTTELSPDEIHERGLREVARINSALEELARSAGYASLKSFRTALNENPKYTPTSGSQIVEDFRRYVQSMQPGLAKLFLAYPIASLIVEPVPASQPGVPTHYVEGLANGSRAARIVVATSDYAQRKLMSDETLAYHEGIPGHHLQISIEQELKGLPQFRRHLIQPGFVEGWAVYAEALGKEAGLFEEPASDYGRLNTELIRALRLVLDTGIHAKHWTRSQAVAYFRASGAADEPTMQAEVDRYIASPAQGLSYKLGQMKILELRRRSEMALGKAFDVRVFHDEVLGAGSLPLDVLDERLTNWLSREVHDGVARSQP